MKVVIVAAGRATRLFPITKHTPKCLLDVGGKAIIDYQIDALKKSGIKDIIVVTGHESKQVEKHLSGRVDCVYNPFYGNSGMLMSLWLVKNEIKDGFVFLYSDVLFEEGILKELLGSSGDVCLAVDSGEVDEESEKVRVEKDIVTKISKIHMVPAEVYGGFIGIAKFSQKGATALSNVLDDIAREDIDAYFISSIERLIQNGEKINFCDITGKKWIDIDFVEDLEKARQLFSST